MKKLNKGFYLQFENEDWETAVKAHFYDGFATVERAIQEANFDTAGSNYEIKNESSKIMAKGNTANRDGSIVASVFVEDLYGQ